jgi:excisionase family DNA binding protein
MRSSEANETAWLSTGEAAAKLGTSKNTIIRMCAAGRLTVRRRTSLAAGRPWRREIDPGSVARVLAEREAAEGGREANSG